MLSLSKAGLVVFRTGASAVGYLKKATLYSGPESDCKNDINFGSDWQSEKRKLIQRKVMLMGQGIDVDSDINLIDESIRKVSELPHHIMADDVDKYFTEEVPTNYFNITGSNVTETPEKSLSSKSNADLDFYKPEVQDILKRITGKNMNKIFSKRVGQHTEMPRVRLLTSHQLEEEIKKKELEADLLLKMPPVMIEREEIDEVVAYDEYLDGFEECNIAFVDISEDIPKNERFMVVREPNGLLRKSKWNERDRYQQVYFPIEGRHIVNKPWLFSDLSMAFKNKLHANVLEQVLIEFEPDSPEYISLFHQVYDDINERFLFADLHSTRYFGGLAFYLSKHRTPDNLLIHLLQNSQITDAADLVRLHYILHIKDEIEVTQNSKSIDDCINSVQQYISSSSNEKSLQLALDTYKLNQTGEIESSTS